jgi:hypothetical protein
MDLNVSLQISTTSEGVDDVSAVAQTLGSLLKNNGVFRVRELIVAADEPAAG